MSSLKSLLTSAQKAYKAGEYAAALDCCKRALRTEGGEQSATVHLTFAVRRARLEPHGTRTLTCRRPQAGLPHTTVTARMRARKHAPWRAQAVFTAQEEPEMAERAFGSALATLTLALTLPLTLTLTLTLTPTLTLALTFTLAGR